MSPRTLTIAAIASIGALDLSSVPAAAQATPLSENPAHTQAVTASHTETEISIEPDQFNATGIPGLALTARGAGAEALSISEDGSGFTVRGADGTVVGGVACIAALVSTNTQINWGSHC